MKINLTILLVLFSFVLFGQRSTLDCGGRQYEHYSFLFDHYGENCRNKYYGQANFKDLPLKDTSVINKIKGQIENRGGSYFYKQLEVSGITISDSSKKCNNIKYTFRFKYKIDTTFNYCFSLDYDKTGTLISNNAFPSVAENPDFYKLSPVCNLINNVSSDTSFTNFYVFFKNDFQSAIDKVLLEYDNPNNMFVYKIVGRTIAESNDFKSGLIGWWNGKIIVINARTGEKIRTENYRKYKYMDFR